MQRRMREMRLACLRQIRTQEQKIGAANDTLSRWLDSVKRTAEITVQRQAELGKLKENLRELEERLATFKEVNKGNIENSARISKSISTTRARCSELEKVVAEQKAKKEKWEAILSQQFQALRTLEEKNNEDDNYRKGQKEVISWYNKFLGIRIETHHGIKFMFSNISSNAPDKEISFTIKYSQDTYTLLDSDPHVKDTEQILYDLNRTNGLFNFVRLMRVKLQEAAWEGCPSGSGSILCDSVLITSLAPGSSVSAGSSEDASLHDTENQLKARPTQNSSGGKKSRQRTAKLPVSLSVSSPAVRRSPRLLVRYGVVLVKAAPTKWGCLPCPFV